MIEKYSIDCLVDYNDSSSKSEEQVLAYIAQELNVSPDKLIVPDFKCCTCFNLLRDKFYRIGFPSFSLLERQCEKLGIQVGDEGITKSSVCLL